MVKSSPWTRFLPPLGVALALVLIAAATVLWIGGTAAGAGSGGALGRLMTVAENTRLTARRALAGDAGSLEVLADRRRQIASLRRAAAAADAPSAVRQFTQSPDWQTFDSSLEKIAGARASITDFHAARQELLAAAPDILAAAGNVASALPPAALKTDQIFLDRLELNVESVQTGARALAQPGPVEDVVQKLSGQVQYIDQILRGLGGDDSGLGIAAVTDAAVAKTLDAAGTPLDRLRSSVGRLMASAGVLQQLDAAASALDQAADKLLDAYQGIDAGRSAPGGTGTLALGLVAAAGAILALMMFAYYRARDFRRAAAIQAEQNERNQQAILRLLDELSNLADGDLTVQATVTEDITGAIADSINYAIDALRELVTTIDESSILVDGAAKQTEATARQLVRSAQTQSKQAAAASESIAQMVNSVEEVAGNAERCSDVAHHAVDVAHKGGEAVRRTIDGMNTIRETIQDTAKRIKRLGESSQEIGNIVELIEEIAEQTNILALNASIEASRAGEASRGFAVVADEVQKLAERSSNATRKIEVLVSTIQSDTNEAVISMERSTTDVVGGALLAENAGAALEEIEQVSHQIASLVQNISGSAHDQTSVATAIDKNMRVLREISSKASESTAATSSAISKLSELASQLRRTVSGFKLPDNVTGTGMLSQARVAQGLVAAEDDSVPEQGDAQHALRRQSV
jgi:twitching motility protein PilJ